MSLSIETLALAKKFAKNYTDTAIAQLPNGIVYKGAVNYYTDLPSGATEGDAYTVLYKGTTGTVSDGTEYVWGKVDNQLQWIPLGRADQLVEVQYGVTSVDEILAIIEQGQIPYIRTTSQVGLMNYYYYGTFVQNSGGIDSVLVVFCSVQFFTSRLHQSDRKQEIHIIEAFKRSDSSQDEWYQSDRELRGFKVLYGTSGLDDCLGNNILPVYSGLSSPGFNIPSREVSIDGNTYLEFGTCSGDFYIPEQLGIFRDGYHVAYPLIEITYNDTPFPDIIQLAADRKSVV